MKKIIILFFSLAVLAACNGKKSDHHDDASHQHESDHAHGDSHDHTADAPIQEEFTVGNDTVKTDVHAHGHVDGQPHKHQD